MTDNALDALATAACNPKTSKSELRRVALVAIGELSMLRLEYVVLKETTIGYAMAEMNFAVCDPTLSGGVVE